MQVSEAAAALCSSWFGTDATFEGVVIDSRRVSPGNLFVALDGERTEGHRFVADAHARGAAAVMVETRTDAAVPGLLVDDARAAMASLASAWRDRFDLPVAAVTGSNGKTTVKEMLAAMVSEAGPALVTEGNLNNDLGVPLTLYRLAPEHRHAVVEMGANHVGEIARLAGMARPQVGVITQCAAAHLEGFGSIEGVARGKGEMVESLPVDGTAILNADDRFIDYWRERSTAGRTLTFGLENPADVSADWHQTEDGLQLRLMLAGRELDVSLALLGRHNVMNALAATAAAHALDLDDAAMSAGLARMRAVPGRLALMRTEAGTALIDDSYNANPESLAAAIDVLADFAAPRWLVMGDMAELGDDAAGFHRRAGETARLHGVERLFALGEGSRETVRAFGSGGEHFESLEALLDRLLPGAADAGALLVKGSRSMQMERVVEALVGKVA